MADRNLPRYKPGGEVKREAQIVNIEGIGSFKLVPPTLDEQIAYEERGDKGDEGAKKSTKKNIATIVCHVLVEPELTEAELEKEVATWPAPAALRLMAEALRVAGLSEEVIRSAETEFRNSDQ